MPVTLHQTTPDDLAPEEIERWRDIPVAIAVDLGRGLGQIDPAVRLLGPLGQGRRLFGRAVTARCEPPDFGAVLYAVDEVGRGEVLVIAAAGNAETAMIGEILGGHLRRKGAAGIVCDGAVRDVGTLVSFADLPVFARSITPRGPLSGERGDVNAQVIVGGALVRPGDLIMGDDDGLVALSPSFIRSRIGDAQARIAQEAEWETSLAGGRSMRKTFTLATPRRVGG